MTDGAASISFSFALPIAALMDRRSIKSSESIIKDVSSPKQDTLKNGTEIFSLTIIQLKELAHILLSICIITHHLSD